jgi:hypothetical protein
LPLAPWHAAQTAALAAPASALPRAKAAGASTTDNNNTAMTLAEGREMNISQAPDIEFNRSSLH